MASRTKDCVGCGWLGIVLMLFAVGILTLLVMLIAPPAKGEALLNNHASCAHLGALAVDVREAKDQGINWPALLEYIGPKVKEARKNPESYVQSDADEAYVLRVLKLAFDSKLLSYEVGTAVYRDCMAKRIGA